jgi:hypothetical protein
MKNSNQSNSWKHLEKTIDEFTEQNEILNDYYECLIECRDDQAACKRVCRKILAS